MLSWSSEVHLAEVGVDRLADLVDLLLGGVALGVEPRLEQLHERRAEMCACSASASLRYSSVKRVETRMRYFRSARRICTCCQSRSVRVTSRFSESDSVSPRHTAEIVAATLSRLLAEVEHGAAGIQHAEVVDVDLALAEHLGRDLLDDAQAERLEDRHEGREIDLAAGLVQLHAREALARRLVPDADDEAVGRSPRAPRA